MDELITELMKRVADEAAVPTIGAPCISRAARTCNRSGRSTCIITLNYNGEGRSIPPPSILGVACFLNRAGSRDLVRVYPVKQVERIS